MEAWENKIIADKLNGLHDLPEDYAPNVTSKWEIIQSGLQGKHRRVHVGWWIGFGLLLLVGLAIGFLSVKECENAAVIPPEKNKFLPISTMETIAAYPRPQPEKTTPIIKTQKRKIISTPAQVSDDLRLKPVILQSSNRLADSTIRIRTDSAKISSPFAELKMQKQKPKLFQKDFEGFATGSDTAQQKTASKGLQFRWRSHDDKSVNTDEPKLRLTQKF